MISLLQHVLRSPRLGHKARPISVIARKRCASIVTRQSLERQKENAGLPRRVDVTLAGESGLFFHPGRRLRRIDATFKHVKCVQPAATLKWDRFFLPRSYESQERVCLVLRFPQRQGKRHAISTTAGDGCAGFENPVNLVILSEKEQSR